jgi:hypothetical protein
MCRAIRHNTQNSVLSTTMHFHNNDKGISDPNTPPHSWGSGKSKKQIGRKNMYNTPPFLWNKCFYYVSSNSFQIQGY